MRPPVSLNDLTEKEWAGQVAELARTLGFRRYHTYRSTRSEPGFPDEVLVRDRLIFLELKTEKGKLSHAQAEWLDALLGAGCEAYVVRPSDLDALGKVLAHRGPRLSTGEVFVSTEDLREATRVEVRGVLGREAQAA